VVLVGPSDLIRTHAGAYEGPAVQPMTPGSLSALGGERVTEGT